MNNGQAGRDHWSLVDAYMNDAVRRCLL